MVLNCTIREKMIDRNKRTSKKENYYYMHIFDSIHAHPWKKIGSLISHYACANWKSKAAPHIDKKYWIKRKKIPLNYTIYINKQNYTIKF
jgi:hypothetical protein